MNKKKWLVLTLAALLLLSVFAFAIVALAEDGETPPPFISGDLEPDNAKKKKATATPGRGLWTASPTPKPTPAPTPEPTEFPFFPGLREDHEGHTVTEKVFTNITQHTIRTYCEDCKKYFGGETVEPHSFNAEGVCSVCGYLCSPHSWAHDSYKNDGNTETHIEVLVCTVCGCKKDGVRTAHRPVHIDWENVSDTQHRETVRCNICEQTYTLAPVEHVFKSECRTNGSADHTVLRICEKCGAHQAGSEKTERHSYDPGNASDEPDSKKPFIKRCTECGQYSNHDHALEPFVMPKEWVALNGEQHIGKGRCRLCAEIITDIHYVYDHTFDPVTMKCTACGYLKEGCAHSYDLKPVPSLITDEGHTLTGTCTKCGKPYTTTGAHTMKPVSATEFVFADDTYHQHTVLDRCTVCGYESERNERAEHRYTFVSESYENDETSLFRHKHIIIEKCEDCGHQREIVERKEHFLSQIDENGSFCNTCGTHFEHVFEIATTHDPEKHECKTLYKCKRCKYETAPHKTEIYEPVYMGASMINNLKHEEYYRCSLCGGRTKTVRPHTFEKAPGSKSYEKRCVLCGMREDEEMLTASAPELAKDAPELWYLVSRDGTYISCAELVYAPAGCEALELHLLPETVPEGAFELHLTAPSLEKVTELGAGSVYVSLKDSELLIFGDAQQTLDDLTAQELTELVIQAAPGPDGAYTVIANPV